MLKTLAVAAGLAAFAAAPALAEDLDFMLTNNTGVAMDAFHVSHTGTNSWEENLLAGGILDDGYEISVLIADGRTTCMYDIRAEFTDGDVVEDYGVDLCDLGGYTFE